MLDNKNHRYEGGEDILTLSGDDAQKVFESRNTLKILLVFYTKNIIFNDLSLRGL